jgi:hypothetical protein
MEQMGNGGDTNNANQQRIDNNALTVLKALAQPPQSLLSLGISRQMSNVTLSNLKTRSFRDFCAMILALLD